MKVKKIGKSLLIFIAFFVLFVVIGLGVGIYANANEGRGFSGYVGELVDDFLDERISQNNVTLVSDTAITSYPSMFSGIKWTLLDTRLYGGVEGGTDNEFERYEDEDVLKVSAVEKIFSVSLAAVGYMAYTWFTSWEIDLSIDSLIYGRMAMDYDSAADFTHFGLESNNPYGIAGATIFYLLRRLVLSLVPVFALFMLIKQLFQNTSKGRAQLKDFIQNLIVMLLLLFAMPYLINFFIYLRDAFMWAMSKGMASMYESMGIVRYNFGNSIVNQMLLMYLETPSFFSAILLLAAVGAGIFFFVHYISVAALLALGFGLFPIVAIWSLFNRRVLTEWLNIMLPNLLLPFIDLLIFQIPSIIYNVYVGTFESTGGVVLSVIILVVIWKTVSIRNRWIKVFGFDGIGGSSNMGLALMAARVMGGLTKGRSSGKVSAGGSAAGGVVTETSDGASLMREANERGALMASADANMDMSMHGGTWSSQSDYGNDTNKLIEEMNDRYEPLEEGTGSLAGGGVADGGMVVMEDGAIGEAVPNMDMAAPLSDYDVAMDEDGSVGGLLTDGYDESMTDNLISAERPYVPEMEHMTAPAAGVTMAQMGTDSISGGRMAEGVDAPVRPDIINASSSIVEQGPVVSANAITRQDVHSSNKYDGVFADSLSERDKGRYENLVRKDMYSDKIAANQSYMNQVGYNRATYEQEKQSLRDNIGRLNEPIASVTQKVNSISDKSSPEYVQAKSDLQRLTDTKKAGEERMAQLDRAANMDKQNSVYRQHMDNCEQRERQYAYNSGLGGMSDKAYDNANNFKYQTQVNNIKKKQMDYKNFDSKQYEGILTPQERSDYYRQRAMKEHETRVLNAAATFGKVAVGATVAVPAMAMMAYGGPTAMAAGAYAGNVAGSGLQKTIHNSARMGENAAATAAEPRRENVTEPVYNKMPARAPESNRINSVRKEMQKHSDNQVNKINAAQSVRREEVNQLNVDVSRRSADMEARIQDLI